MSAEKAPSLSLDHEMERVSTVFRRQLPGIRASREHVLDMVVKACRTTPADEREFEFQAVSVVGEAFNNIVLHGYGSSVAGDIEIEIESTPEQLLVVLVDTGCGFEPRLVERPLEPLPESGMGIPIINAWMDEVDYLRGPPNILRLVKYRRAKCSPNSDVRTKRYAP